jgi:hypothetical protein
VLTDDERPFVIYDRAARPRDAPSREETGR